MSKPYLVIVAAILAGCFYGCNNRGNQPPPASVGSRAMLLGKWSLHQQKVVQYIDAIKTTDTMYTAADTNYSYVQFNSSDAYVSNAYFGPSSPLNLNAVISVDSTKGTFSFLGTKFSLSGLLTGLGQNLPVGISGTLPVMKLVSKTELINVLTQNKLTLHQETVITQTVAADTKTYKSILDFYYTR